MPLPSPLTLAGTASTWGPLDWWRLEMHALRPTSAAAEVAVISPKAVWSKAGKGPVPWLGCLLVPLFIASFVTPLFGALLMVAAVIDDDGFDWALAAAGWLTLVSVAVTVYGEWQERRHPRALTTGTVLIIAGLHLLPGVVTLGIGLLVALPSVEGASRWWLLVVVADVAIHIAMLVRGRTRRGGPQHPIDNVQRAVAELPADVAATVIAERRAAIDLLVERALIDVETAERAKAAPLGLLGPTMAPALLPEHIRAGVDRHD